MSYKHLTKCGERFIKQSMIKPLNHELKFEKIERQSTPEFLRSELPRVEDEKRFRTVKDWSFLPGDRVVIVKRGKWKGKISMIHQHDPETNGYVLDNGPTRAVPIPKEFWQEGQGSHISNIPIVVSKKDIKLVADIDDPNSPGKVKTVGIRDIVYRDKYYDEDYKRIMPYRCVGGQENLIIPWPRPKQTEDGYLGTDPHVTREQTFFVDSVVRAPIPEGALLTIRNPKSKYRRGTLSAKDIAKLVAPKMPLTDTKKAYIKERQEQSKREKRKLTDGDKEQIGAQIFEHFKNRM